MCWTRWTFKVSVNLVIFIHLRTQTYTCACDLVCLWEHNCGFSCDNCVNSAHLTAAHLRLIIHERHFHVLPACSLNGSSAHPLCSPRTHCHMAAAEMSLIFVVCTPQWTGMLGLSAGSALLVNLTLFCSACPWQPCDLESKADAYSKLAALTDPLVKSSHFDSFLIKFQ